MYTVLLADDERLDLVGLKRLVPWERFHMKVDAAVTNGFSALEYIRKRPVDVLITDVRMPRMSGLELAQAALTIHRSLKIVFISGYEDFHYAKSALAMGAVNYVLKPIDDGELIQTLEEVKGLLDREREQELRDETYNDSLPALRSEIVRQGIEGTIQGEHLAVRLASLGVEPGAGPYTVALIETDDISWKLNPYPEQEREEIVEHIQAEIMQYCASTQLGLTCRIRTGLIGILMEGDHTETLEHLIHHITSRFPLSITIGRGEPVHQLDHVHDSYQEAKKALSAKMICGKGKLISLDMLGTGTVAEAQDMDEILSDLYQAVSEYKLVQIDDCLLRLFSLAAKLENKLTIYNLSIHLMTKLSAYLQLINEDLYRLLGLKYQNLDVLYQFETIDDIHSWFRRKLFEISEMLHIKKLNKYRKIIADVKQYIDERIETDLTLKEVAEYFFFSPNHLGFLFKEETGQTFSEYMIQTRMETARSLLANSHLKIYEVAHRCGYHNIAYFSRQFKDRYGMTPGEYRKHYMTQQ